jgi:hypothetical protein
LSESGTIVEASAEGVTVYNGTDLPDTAVRAAVEPLMDALIRWGNDIRPPTRHGGIFERDRYITPIHVFEQMRLAYHAAEADDVVAGVLEASESLAMSRMDIFAEDPDEQDVYNQIAADLDLDSRLREMWRELFIVSQFVVAIWWGNKTYKVRGKTDQGVKRKKEFNLRVPLGVTLLDPLKIIPVGMLLFNNEQLAYMADANEGRIFDDIIENRTSLGPDDDPMHDPLLQRLLIGKYEPTQTDIAWMSGAAIDTRRLYLLNPTMVFRHTTTRPQYQPFAPIRMRSIFELLDLKSQLHQMDRAHLVGGTNFIVVVTKGTDAHPAKPIEIAHLQAQVRTVARLPVLVGDHRLNVEIVTPKLDNTLKAERYNALDGRITARLYLTMMSGAYQTGTTGDDSIKLTKVIARGLESRRHMLRRSLEANLFGPLFDSNPSLETKPKLRFHPKNIALDFDMNFATFLLDLRAAGELSRETILSQFDMDQADEAEMIERERELYDPIFHTAVPFDSPQNNQQRQPTAQPQPTQNKPATDPAAKPPQDDSGASTPAGQRRAGRRAGGTRNGGGAAPGTGQGQPAKNPRRKSQ